MHRSGQSRRHTPGSRRFERVSRMAGRATTTMPLRTPNAEQFSFTFSTFSRPKPSRDAHTLHYKVNIIIVVPSIGEFECVSRSPRPHNIAGPSLVVFFLDYWGCSSSV